MTTINLSQGEAELLKSCLQALTENFRQYPRMIPGSSEVHNLYWSHIEVLRRVCDKISV